MYEKRYRDYLRELEEIETEIDGLVHKANNLSAQAEIALERENLMADAGDKGVIIDRGQMRNCVVTEVLPPMDKLRRLPSYAVKIEGIEYPTRVVAGEFVITERVNAS